jgi:hypothetical protein
LLPRLGRSLARAITANLLMVALAFGC